MGGEGPALVASLTGIQARGPRRGRGPGVPHLHAPARRGGEGRGEGGRGGEGRGAAKGPAAGLACVRRVRRVVAGGSGSAGTGRAGRLARGWAGGRPAGRSRGHCRWSRGEAGWWRGIWLSCWRCTGGRQGEEGVSRAADAATRGPWRGEPVATRGRDGRAVARLTEPRWRGSGVAGGLHERRPAPTPQAPLPGNGSALSRGCLPGLG